ncbi:MAG: hypothetical protein A2504_14265 [Bdellovibrionales bacterium RIFOXYD12_FULL_39_22]|nr:MAG: hypothetical protein A2385_04700 [Bdellovibrionales bacterium RIFOXYB1_FULL_39_21]OFZ43447.1 MAG: hypothetical protein A2485_13215 [Bdellovibrionales bacterium RIFOXYC12_FULL_39_17]OFZ46990.1 MAG: hypothetical protein A2404_00275 [Bdellovibrionales bacterium RIFOXYC1_FULL_39_130]OFZ76187.1 MAG: hypothetical protein A2560_07525 [Bdellovibrionales bacterium RIFOXYD1_FULL_39_84]OFZ94422.1 MAG: hypothetical protein A2504_14265 [Bdellovibrionales bacterium RIFOXYD12_FULL_39_22]HLE10537.1 hy
MIIYKTIGCLLLVVTLTSCSSGLLNISTVPEKVSVKIREEDGQIRDLGLTPVRMDSSDFFKGNNFVQVILSKEGYDNEKIVLIRPSLEGSITLSVEMLKGGGSVKEALSSVELERLATLIASSQQFFYAKKYSEAENSLKKLIIEFPDVSLSYDLLGNIYYLQNQHEKALGMYRRADEISPRNIERNRMIDKLQQEFPEKK